jgi:hypothetical protein
MNHLETDKMITIFDKFSNTTKPKYVEIGYVLNAIKECKIQGKIDEIRSCNNEKKKKELKNLLPCVLFSGVFTERKDKSIQSHSSFVVLDWDKVTDLNKKKEEICSHPFIYSCFISPSGNGLKAIAVIPPIIEKHRGYYKGLVKYFPELDATSINESRICFMSSDKDIYINKQAIEFTDYVEVLDAKVNNKVTIKAQTNNYSKADIALKIIRDSIDGEKHANLLKASKLMGGFIAGGFIDEIEAIRLLENEISNKGIDSIEAAKVTIKDGLKYGKESPIVEDIKQDYVSKTQSKISVTDNDYSFTSDELEVNDYLTRWRTGTFEKGLTTGLPSLDKYFVFKKGNYNVVNGFDNVGKSTALWYLTLLSAMYHKWKWIILSSENRNGAVVKKLVEFYWGVQIDKLTDFQYREGIKFINKHFTIIKNETLYNYKDVLNMAEKLSLKDKYDGILIDPYNSLKIDLSNNSKLSTHEYHYEAASEMQMFAKQKNMCVYLNCHVITGAMRLQKGETKLNAPGKGDTEGGGKFSNKADDFMTFHRDVQDIENYTKMQIHVRKIKEVETGGGYTPHGDPYILEMQKGMCSYADEYGFNPIQEYWNKQGKQISVITENTDFLNEKKVYNDNLMGDEQTIYL